MGKKRSAYFSLCEECGWHGHIVFANGEESREFSTKYRGLEVLKELVLEERVTRSEGIRIMRQIETSDMSSESAEEDELFEKMLESGDGSEEDIQIAFDDLHRRIRSGEIVEDEKEYLQ